MVSQARLAAAWISLGSCLALAACSPSQWWGEPAPAAQIIGEVSTSKPCPDKSLIFEGSEPESRAAFECFARDVDQVWHDVRGTRHESLSENEILELAREGVFEIDPDRGLSARRVWSIKRALGFDGAITKTAMESWIDWFGKNRTEARELYHVFVRRDVPITYSEIRAGAEFLASLLQKTHWSMNADELAQVIAPFFPRSNPFLSSAPLTLARVGINITAAICPTLSDKHKLNAQEVASCLPGIAAHFEVGADWFEFLLNGSPVNAPKDRISRALDRLVPAVDAWFTQPQLADIDTMLWIDLARSLGIDVAERALDSIKWVAKFDSRSTERDLSPTLMIPVFAMYKDFQKSVLEGLPYFAGYCSNGPVSSWRQCQPRDPQALRQKSQAIDLALRIRNLNYAREALPFDGALFERIMFFHAAARQVILAFDENNDHVITVASNFSENNEVLDLLTVGFNFLKNTAFVNNIFHRLRNEPLEQEDAGDTFRKFDLSGLTKLVTLMGDTLTPRNKQERTFLEGLLENIGNIFPESALHLDQIRLASVISLLDSLGTIRRAMLDPANLEPDEAAGLAAQVAPGGHIMIRRDAVVEALPHMLKVHFPRLYQSCMRFGWDASCSVVLDQVLPNPVAGTDGLIHPADLDVVVLTAVFAESVLDACDYNHDQKLSWKILDGDDELDCTFTRLKDTAKRLMDARIIHSTPAVRTLLDLVNSVFFTRIIGKVALVRGTRDHLWLQVPLSFLHRNATLGSILGLAAEVMDKPRVERARKDRRTDQPEPGPAAGRGN